MGLLFIPNLRLIATLATAYYLLMIFFAPALFFGDADPGWHIRTGEWILDNHKLPTVDPFSFVEVHRPWYTWEWLAEVGMALVYRAGGLTGITFFFVVVLLSVVWLWFSLQTALGGSFLFAALLAPMLVSATQLHWLARPHMFSSLFLLGSLWYLEKQPRWSWKQAVLLVAFGSLWANTHPSFFVPVLIGGCYLLARDGRSWERLAAGAAFSAGTLINPFFLGLHLHILEFLTVEEYRENIGEWMPFTFTKDQPVLIAPMFVIAAIGLLVAWKQGRRHHAATIGLILLLGLRSSRNVPLVAMLALPLVNVAFTLALQRSRGNLLRGIRELTSELTLIDRRFGGYALVPLALVLIFAFLNRPDIREKTGFSERLQPVRAGTFLQKQGTDLRVFANVLEGGYLFWLFAGKPRVFIDGRGDYLGRGPYQEARVAVQAQPGWEAIFAKYKFTHALLARNMPLAPALLAKGWREVYADPTYLVLQRPGG